MMKIKKKGIFSIFLSIIILFGMLIQTSIPVSAQGNNSEKTEIKITDFSIEHKDGTTGNTYAWWEEFKLKMNWDASMYQNNLREGDYFDVKLPDKMKFPTNSAATHFDISAPDGSVLAKAVVTPNKNGGGKLRVTFTNYVESRSNIKGTMWLAATFYGEKITYGGQNVFDITVNGKVSRITVPSITGPTKPNNEILGKWSESTDSETEALWNLRINHKKGTYPNVVIKDSLYTYDDNLQGMHYIPGTFKLEEVEYNEYGDTIRTLSTTDISDKIKFNRDKTSFTYNLGDVNGKQYRLRYRSTYVPGVKLGNKANIKSKTDNFTTTSTYQNASSGGNGQGDLLGKIKIIKVDAENTEIKLAGARFKITRISDGKTFDITTDSNGEAISERLIPGDYKLQEIVAPPGYESDSTEYTVTVSSEKATIQTIKNEPVKTSVSVNKKWVGKKQDSVTVHLIADNVDTGKSATLNKANHWQHTFGNLRKFNSDGTEIKYTIKEDIPNGYENKITGSQKNGYTITNTNVEKIAIPVTKTWVGKA
ncbi:Ig-like domain-containing protein, partial [Streptococcus castoreus]|uniref:Ig-like domain-containing protein n=1 Tax=Streptococcus castoreus TaxID=254786 RepID=UPI0012EC31FF